MSNLYTPPHSEQEALPSLEDYKLMVESHHFLGFLKEDQKSFKFLADHRVLVTEGKLLRIARVGGIKYLQTLLEHLEKIQQERAMDQKTLKEDLMRQQMELKSGDEEFDRFVSLCRMFDFFYQINPSLVVRTAEAEKHSEIKGIIAKHGGKVDSNKYYVYWKHLKQVRSCIEFD